MLQTDGFLRIFFFDRLLFKHLYFIQEKCLQWIGNEFYKQIHVLFSVILGCFCSVGLFFLSHRFVGHSLSFTGLVIFLFSLILKVHNIIQLHQVKIS